MTDTGQEQAKPIQFAYEKLWLFADDIAAGDLSMAEAVAEARRLLLDLPRVKLPNFVIDYNEEHDYDKRD